VMYLQLPPPPREVANNGRILFTRQVGHVCPFFLPDDLVQPTRLAINFHFIRFFSSLYLVSGICFLRFIPIQFIFDPDPDLF